MNGLALCAGGGGLELGIRLAVGDSYSAIGYVEREIYCAEILAARMEEDTFNHAPIWDSLESFDGNAFRGTVDIVTAGLPCQPYSVAGSRRGHDDVRAVWPEFVRIIEECRPALVFIENVTGFLKEFEPIYDRLRDMGFIFAPPGIYTASECGAPHLRRRLFILATHPSRITLRQREQWESGGQEVGVRDQGRSVTGDDDTKHADTGSARLQGELEAGPAPWTTRRDGRELTDTDSGRREKFGLSKQGRQQSAHGGLVDRLRSTWGIFDGRLVYNGTRVGPWTAKSPVLRVANGLAGRPRQLRAIGGGVVPAVAARAFLDLSEQLGLTYETGGWHGDRDG
jgi:DNA (cytosine-5)-methyltransferase 1